MLRKMLLQGLAAAAIIAGAATIYATTVYAGTDDNPPASATGMSQAAPAVKSDTGYLQPDARNSGKRHDDHERSSKDGRKKDREHHGNRRHADHDDD